MTDINKPATVKPLDWEEPSASTNQCWIAKSPFGTYSVANEDGWYAAREPEGFWEWNGDRIIDTRHTAFAACQSDYEVRILSALVPSPALEANPVQDTYFVDRDLPIMALSGDVESDRVLKLHFRRPVSDEDRKTLVKAMNVYQASLASAHAREHLVGPAPWNPDEHTDDLAVDRLAAAMKAKLARKRKQGRGGWEDKTRCSNVHLSQLLRDHVEKGDPLDVANLAMMIHQRDERIASAYPETPRRALRSALDHIEHMAAWIGKQNAGYSFESLGETMPGMRAALENPAPVHSLSGSEDDFTPYEKALRDAVEPFLDWLEQREEGAHIEEVREGLIGVEDVIPDSVVALGAHLRSDKDQGVLTIGHFRKLQHAYDGEAALSAPAMEGK